MTPEDLARFIHKQYEALAPAFGYKTRNASKFPFDEIPENNRKLMIAVSILAYEKMEKHFNQLFAMRVRVQRTVGNWISLDLGQIGPSRLQVLSLVKDVVYLKYDTGKEITLDIKTVYEQIR
jgi:hypothetical protein